MVTALAAQAGLHIQNTMCRVFTRLHKEVFYSNAHISLRNACAVEHMLWISLTFNLKYISSLTIGFSLGGVVSISAGWVKVRNSIHTKDMFFLSFILPASTPPPPLPCLFIPHKITPVQVHASWNNNWNMKWFRDSETLIPWSLQAHSDSISQGEFGPWLSKQFVITSSNFIDRPTLT